MQIALRKTDNEGENSRRLIWSETPIPDLNSGWMKVQVLDVFSVLNNGFTEIEVYTGLSKL